MSNKLIVKDSGGAVVSAVLRRAGPNAMFAAEEFFKAALSNEHTKRAYGRVVRCFLAWCERHGHDLHKITPGMAGDYIAGLKCSAPTRNQALAALRHFFDVLVKRHAVVLNSFASVRGTRYSILDGKTAEIAISQAKKLFRSLDTSHVVGLRDRAILGVLAYTGARIGAVFRLKLGDYRNLGEQRVLRFHEKGGKEREIPVRHDLEAWLREYLRTAGMENGDKHTPLFRAANRKSRRLTAHSMRQMLKRHLKRAGLPDIFSLHSFRVAVVTDLLKQDVPLEDVQYLAGHSDPKTTQIYDRRRRRVTRNIVERISTMHAEDTDRRKENRRERED